MISSQDINAIRLLASYAISYCPESLPTQYTTPLTNHSYPIAIAAQAAQVIVFLPEPHFQTADGCTVDTIVIPLLPKGGE